MSIVTVYVYAAISPKLPHGFDKYTSCGKTTAQCIWHQKGPKKIVAEVGYIKGFSKNTRQV